jgi:hypothetical protein
MRVDGMLNAFSRTVVPTLVAVSEAGEMALPQTPDSMMGLNMISKSIPMGI